MAEEKRHEGKPETITISVDMLNELIASKARESVAALLSKPPDLQFQEDMDRMRGKDRPLRPETLVKCLSPITGARFTLRVNPVSRGLPAGRIVEMIDYERPAGWDKKIADGGLYYDGDDFPLTNKDGTPNKLYLKWVYENFWRRDWSELSGKPASFADQWRVKE